MYNSFGKGLETLFWMVFILLLTTIPLAIWKLADVAIWLFDHISVTWK